MTDSVSCPLFSFLRLFSPNIYPSARPCCRSLPVLTTFRTTPNKMDGMQDMVKRFKRPLPFSLSGDQSANWKKFKTGLQDFICTRGLTEKTDEMKVATLLNLIGEEARELFATFTLTEDEKQNYEAVMQAFENYAELTRNVVAARFKFNVRTQGPKESFDAYLADLNKLISICNYGDQRDDILRDHIVFGLEDKKIQERLLREPNLDLKRTLEFCRAASSVLTCGVCKEKLMEKYIVQCVSMQQHKFCFPCTREFIKSHKYSEDVHCPSGDKCPVTNSNVPWAFMQAEIAIILSDDNKEREA